MGMNNFLFLNDVIKTGPYAHKTFAEKFHTQYKIISTDDCWEWSSKLYRNGYGCFSAREYRYLAHRVSYFLNHGDFPDGLLVCHTCDNPPCVNPSHLFLGSHQDNVNDKISKGRDNCARGERSGKTTLSDSEVIEIKTLLAYTNIQQKDIAKMYGVLSNTISRINTGARWSHLVIETKAKVNIADLISRQERGMTKGTGDDR